MKLKYISAVVACAVLLPFAANALSAGDLATQIQALLAQVTALQQQLKALQSTSVVTDTSKNTCPTVSRSLSLGISGDDVLSLQQFLFAQNFLSAEATTGSFDSRTETAVQRLQAGYGIVSSGTAATTGYGVVGPRTRSLIALNCSTPVTPSCPIAPPPTTICSAGWQANTDANGCTTSYRCSTPLPGATPTLGACTAISLLCPAGTQDRVGPNCSHSCVSTTLPPTTIYTLPAWASTTLSVRKAVDPFTVIANFGSGPACAEAYQLSWGDGTSPVTQAYTPSVAGNTCVATARTTEYSHTYASAGTYAIILRAGVSLERVYSTSITVSTSASGLPVLSVSQSPTSVARGNAPGANGGMLSISWSAQNVSTSSAVALWLVKSDGTNAGLIARNQSASGAYAWLVPGPKCDASGACIGLVDSPAAYYTDVGSYYIVAKLYTPVGAYLGGFPPPNPIYPTYLATATSSLFSITSQ